tara:strand:+ start:391 stop:657 length:267 start_codon:yes stop_codon:yes gene_type:complete
MVKKYKQIVTPEGSTRVEITGAELQEIENRIASNNSAEATTLKNNELVVFNRQKEYGTVEKQIEFITEKGLEAWKTNVQAIKTKYPKE